MALNILQISYRQKSICTLLLHNCASFRLAIIFLSIGTLNIGSNHFFLISIFNFLESRLIMLYLHTRFLTSDIT